MPSSPRKIVATAASLRPKRNINKKTDAESEPPAKKTVEKKEEKKPSVQKKKGPLPKTKAKSTAQQKPKGRKPTKKKNDPKSKPDPKKPQPTRQSKRRMKEKVEEDTEEEEEEKTTSKKPALAKRTKPGGKNNSEKEDVKTEEEETEEESKEDDNESESDDSSESIADDGEMDDDDDSDFDPDNDPERLWCFCKKPHGNRFMICCDTCEGWFHGDCVGVSMARGREMEKTGEEWCCKLCKVKQSSNKQLESEQEIQTPLNTPLEKEIDTKPIDQSTLSKARSLSLDSMKSNLAKSLKDKVSTANVASPTSKKPTKETADSKNSEKTNVVSQDKKDVDLKKQLDRAISIEKPSSEETEKKLDTSISEETETHTEKEKTENVLDTSATPTTPTHKAKVKESPEKVHKRRESDKSSFSDLITFDHIPVATKKDSVVKKERHHSTDDEKKKKADIVPKAKAHRTPSVKEKKEPVKYCLREDCNKPAMKNSIYCSRECIYKYTVESLKRLDVEKKKASLIKSPDTKEETKGKIVISAATSSTDRVTVQERIAVFERSSGKIVAGVMAPTKKYLFAWLEEHPTYEIWKSDKESKKMKDPKKDQDELVRSNVRKALRETLLARCKDDQMAINLEVLGKICIKIENEMLKMFGSTGNKYKTKYRSLVFNLRDSQNKVLYKRVVSGEISPKKLVTMTPEQLATPELAQWREQENRKHIEMIKKREEESAELQKKPVVKKTYKGEVEIMGDGAQVFSQNLIEAKQSESLPTKISSMTRHNSSSSVSSLKDETTSSILKDTTSEHSHHLFDSNCKICTGKIAPPGEAHMTGVSTTVLQPEVSDNALNSPIDRDVPVAIMPASPDTSTNITTPPSPTSTSHLSTSKKHTSVWRGFVFMQKVAKFVTTAYGVSGSCDNLMDVLPDTINVCGRIHPKEVWDYLGQLKAGRRLNTHNSIDVIRFEMASDEEKAGYIRFYTYFYTRQRIGVVGNCHTGVKDMYIVPLASTDPVPSELKPLPGLPKPRPHMLLGIIVRVKAHKTKIEDFISIDSSPDLNLPKKKKKKKEKKKEKEIDIERVEFEAQKKLVDILIKSHTSTSDKTPTTSNPLAFLKSLRSATTNILSTDDTQESTSKESEEKNDKQSTAESSNLEKSPESQYKPTNTDKKEAVGQYRPPSADTMEEGESVGQYRPTNSDYNIDRYESDRSTQKNIVDIATVVITPDPLQQKRDEERMLAKDSTNEESSIIIPAPEDVVKNIKVAPADILIDENNSDSEIPKEHEENAKTTASSTASNNKRAENIPLLGNDCSTSTSQTSGFSSTSQTPGSVDFQITSTANVSSMRNEEERIEPSDEDYVANLIENIEMPAPRPPEFPQINALKTTKDDVMPGLPPINIPGFSPPERKPPMSTIEEIVKFRPPAPDAAPWIPLPPNIKLPPGVPFPPLPPTMLANFAPISPPVSSNDTKTAPNIVDPRTRREPLTPAHSESQTLAKPITSTQHPEVHTSRHELPAEKHAIQRKDANASQESQRQSGERELSEKELSDIRTNQLASLIINMSSNSQQMRPPFVEGQPQQPFPNHQKPPMRFQNVQDPQGLQNIQPPIQFPVRNVRPDMQRVPQNAPSNRFTHPHGMIRQDFRPNRFPLPNEPRGERFVRAQDSGIRPHTDHNRFQRPPSQNERFPYNVEDANRFRAPVRNDRPPFRPPLTEQPRKPFRPDSIRPREFNTDFRPRQPGPSNRPLFRNDTPFRNEGPMNNPRFRARGPPPNHPFQPHQRPSNFSDFHASTRFEGPADRTDHGDFEGPFHGNFESDDGRRARRIQNRENQSFRGGFNRNSGRFDDRENDNRNRDFADNEKRQRSFHRDSRYCREADRERRASDNDRERFSRRDSDRRDRRDNWQSDDRSNKRRRREDDDRRRDNDERRRDDSDWRSERHDERRSHVRRNDEKDNNEIEDFRSKIYGSQRYNYREMFERNSSKDNEPKADSQNPKPDKDPILPSSSSTVSAKDNAPENTQNKDIDNT